ncbi:sodium-coupled monocarboxylate transporter 1-like [Mizuhopecten yessoensis]|uniref:sodium-coupled monocarboxylate transporter 1-like n=1 Tax=Mizuhopecten yessoensis TaxID=6573 RepID=UPI000B4571AB|nr:sodium-coupled monocarboxylate transporter 1-like [Mizuhopecten yessoensis]
MMLGVPAEVYMYGMQWYMFIIGKSIADVLNCYLLIPSLKSLNVNSLYEYLELRFHSRVVRLFGTILTLFFYVNYLGTVLFVPTITIQAITDIPVWISVVVLMAVVVIYTLLGGFQAVVWSDVIQAISMTAGMVTIIIKGTMDSGGIGSTWKTITDKGRMNLFIFDPDPTLRQSFWSLMLGGIFSGFGMTLSQISFQRIKATPTVKSAQRMQLIATCGSIIFNLLAVMQGAVMFAYFDRKGCDPLVSKKVTNPNQLIAVLASGIFKNIPCLTGLFLSAVFSASLSTMSSVLGSASSIFLEDIIKPHTKPMSQRREILIAQISVLGFGTVAVVIALCVSGMHGPVTQILTTSSSCLIGAVTGIILLGWYVPSANTLGAVVGGSVSVLFVGWISFGKMMSDDVSSSQLLEPASTERCTFMNVSSNSVSNITLNGVISISSRKNNVTLPFAGDSQEKHGVDLLYSLSYQWLGMVGIVLVLSIGALASRVQGSVPADENLTVSLAGSLCRCSNSPMIVSHQLVNKDPFVDIRRDDDDLVTKDEDAPLVMNMKPVGDTGQVPL